MKKNITFQSHLETINQFDYFCNMTWFKKWFNTSYYHILYKDRDFVEAEIFITKLMDFLKLSQNSKVIDLACGKARHSIFLHQLGFDVLGLDLSEESILQNKKFSQEKLNFAIHDMREEIYPNVSPEKVEAVLNLFTSFGYFESVEEDKMVFRSVKNALQSNGFFVIDFLNQNFVKNTLVEESTVIKENIVFTIQKKIEQNFVIKDIRFSDQGEEFHFFEKVKLHSLEEIEAYAQEFGFEKWAVFGDYHLGEFSLETSPRAVIVFKNSEN